MTTSFSFFVAEAVSAVYALFIHKNHLAGNRETTHETIVQACKIQA